MEYKLNLNERNHIMPNRQKKIRLLASDIAFASKLNNSGLTYYDILSELNKITKYDDVVSYNKSAGNMLWEWIPSIVHSMFGLDVYLNENWETNKNYSYAMIHPVFMDQTAKVRDAILDSNFDIDEEKRIPFSLKLAASIYGGFPWFRSYYRLCNELHMFKNKETIILKIRARHISKSDIIKDLTTFKNEFRKRNGSKVRHQFFSKEEYPGIINVFHTPAHIEFCRFEFFLDREKRSE